MLAPAAWPWALGAVGANHLVLTGGGLWPRSRWLGRNWTRLPAAAAARREIAITIDDGPDPEVTPAVLDLLDAHDAQRDLLLHRLEPRAPHPALCREIVAPRPQRAEPQRSPLARASRCSGRAAMAREIGAAQAPLADITGERAALLPRPGRPAQSLPRAGAAAARPAAGELDAARLRHRAARAGRRAGAPLRRPGAPATSCCCTTATRRAPTTAQPVVARRPAGAARARDRRRAAIRRTLATRCPRGDAQAAAGSIAAATR